MNSATSTPAVMIRARERPLRCGGSCCFAGSVRLVEHAAHWVSPSRVLRRRSRRPGTSSVPSTTDWSSSWARRRSAQYVAPARVAPATIRTSWRRGCSRANSLGVGRVLGDLRVDLGREHEPLDHGGAAGDVVGPHDRLEGDLERLVGRQRVLLDRGERAVLGGGVQPHLRGQVGLLRHDARGVDQRVETGRLVPAGLGDVRLDLEHGGGQGRVLRGVVDLGQ